MGGFNRDLKQFREGAMTTCSGKAFQESITLGLKLLDLSFSYAVSWLV